MVSLKWLLCIRVMSKNGTCLVNGLMRASVSPRGFWCISSTSRTANLLDSIAFRFPARHGMEHGLLNFLQSTNDSVVGIAFIIAFTQ